MSYRKKHSPQKTGKAEPKVPPPELDFTNPGDERTINTANLTSGLPYQRPVNEKEVNRLISQWDERLIDPVIVSFRDGKFYVVDGQHRIIAMRKMNGGRDLMVTCKVYSGLTYEQEAVLCYKLDKAKKRLSLSQSTNILAESGTSAEVLAIIDIIESCGFTWALQKKTGRANEITSTRAVLTTYRLLGGQTFTRMLVLIRSTWPEDTRGLLSGILTGLALFLKTYETEMDDKAFIKRLAKVDPEEIIRRGRLDYSTNRSALRYARIILEKYNAHRGKDKLPYRFNG